MMLSQRVIGIMLKQYAGFVKIKLAGYISFSALSTIVSLPDE